MHMIIFLIVYVTRVQAIIALITVVVKGRQACCLFHTQGYMFAAMIPSCIFSRRQIYRCFILTHAEYFLDVKNRSTAQC